MDTPREDKKSSMRRISNISTLPYYWHTITFLLLACQSFGMVRPENVLNDDITLPEYKEKIPWTDGGAEQILNPLDVMSTIQNIEKPVQYIQDLKETQSIKTVKKPRFICLHGYGSNAEKLKQHFEVWPESVLEKMDLVFINGAFRIDDGITIGEQFIWFSPNKANTEYEDLEEGIAYIEDQMIKLGPFDGVLGFSRLKVSQHVISTIRLLKFLDHYSSIKSNQKINLELLWQVHYQDYKIRVCVSEKSVNLNMLY